MSDKSSAPGLPPGLRVSAEDGSRKARSPPGGVLELIECRSCGWPDVRPDRAWEQWRELAKLILDTPPPQ
jgi:hypothetical protein